MVKSVVFLLALFNKAFDSISENDLIDRLKEIN